jgi:sec-independent protein translocase protein TatA
MGLSEMIVVAVVALLVFGGRLPEVMHTLGKTYAKFRRGMTELSNPIRHEMRRLDEQAKAPRPSTPDRGNVPAADEPPPYEVPAAEADAAKKPADEVAETAPQRDVPLPPTSGGGAADEPPPV